MNPNFVDKSNIVRVIDLDHTKTVKEKSLVVPDYFYDNQALNIQSELIILGFVNVWNVFKENGSCSI